MALVCWALQLTIATAWAGPYSSAVGSTGDANAYDEPIPGYFGPGGEPGLVTLGSTLNPVFVDWASGYADYASAPPADPPYDTVDYAQRRGVAGQFQTPTRLLGPVTGDHFDIVSLGDLYQDQVDAGVEPGQITVTFDRPIRNGAGADFAAFENGSISQGGAGVPGEILAEFAFVEVSTNGSDFARFPSVSLTDALVGPYGTVDPTNVYNLAGKHVNAYPGLANSGSWGTPFNLDDLADDPLVLAGTVDLTDINFVRFIDITGNGQTADQATRLIEPETGEPYTADHMIYDAWVTWGSGGADLEAVGVIHRVEFGDVNRDGVIDGLDIDALFDLAGSDDEDGDLDGSGLVDYDDARQLVEDILGTAFGDANLDGRVNAQDYTALADYFGQSDAGWANADFNGDGRVNAQDYATLAANFGEVYATAETIDPVALPEPTTGLALGALSLTLLARRRRLE